MNCSRSLHAIVAAMACALLTAPAALAATTTTPSGENTPLHLDPVPAAGRDELLSPRRQCMLRST